MKDRVKIAIAVIILVVLMGIEWACKIYNYSGLKDDVKWDTKTNNV